MGQFILGVDLGKIRDYTALAIIEIVPAPLKEVQPNPDVPRIEQVPSGPPSLQLRHLERAPLGTKYPAIVTLAEQRMDALTDTHGRPVLVVDHTGVGVAVVDLFEAAGLEPTAITITGGDAVTREGRHIRVPKRELVTTTQVCMQAGTLKFAEGLADLQTLKNELSTFNYKISAAGNDTYGAWREHDHDDLVLAVALAVWYAKHGYVAPWTKEAMAQLLSRLAV